jgi:5-methylcytosine-specific restriction endonuclease McrA
MSKLGRSQCNGRSLSLQTLIDATWKADGNNGHREQVAAFASGRDLTKVTAKGLLALVESQGFRCMLSGVDLDPSTSNVDHVVPVSKGGKHVMENLVVLHRDVNRAKNTMIADQFVSMCCAIAVNVQQSGFNIEDVASKWAGDRNNAD